MFLSPAVFILSPAPVAVFILYLNPPECQLPYSSPACLFLFLSLCLILCVNNYRNRDGTELLSRSDAPGCDVRTLYQPRHGPFLAILVIHKRGRVWGCVGLNTRLLT